MDKDERRLLMHWYAGQALAMLPDFLNKYDMARTAADMAEAMIEEVEKRISDADRNPVL
jgi:hypothetical protein